MKRKEDELSLLKQKHIFKAYENAIIEFGEMAVFMPKAALIEKAMSFGAPQFYISYDVARRVISLMEKGENVRFKNSCIESMYKEIFRRYNEKKTDKKSFLILETILKERAPSFYINKDRFLYIIYNKLRNR